MMSLALSLAACKDKNDDGEQDVPSDSETDGSDTGKNLPFVGSLGIEYTLNEDGKSYSATGIGNCKESDIVISYGYMGMPVTAIADGAFENCDSITSVKVREGITYIGKNAFTGCDQLTSVTLPSTVSRIGDEAFRQTAITELRLPTGITNVGDYVFADCTSLTFASLSEGSNEVGVGMFSGCTALTEVLLASNTSVIGKRAFDGCELLEKITLPSSLTRVDDEAFCGCPSLYNIRYFGNESDWQKVTVGKGNELLTDAIVFE